MFCLRQKKQYVCVFRKSILDNIEITKANSITNLTCRLSLPFIPFIGLQVTDALFENDSISSKEVNIESEFYSGKIHSITWDNNVKFFYCDVEDHLLSKTNDLSTVKDFYLKQGWNLKVD